MAVALGVEGVVAGEGDDIDEGGWEAFAAFTGGVVVGVAGDPEDAVAVGAGDGQEEACGAEGEMVAAKGGEDVVTDMAEIVVEVEGVSDAEGDGAGDGGAGW